MASQGTPINQLPQGNHSQDEDKQFVQNIINQMQNDSAEAEQAYSQTQQQYNQHQFAVNHQQMQRPEQYNEMEQEVEYEETEEVVKPTMVQSVKAGLKMPLLFVVLFVLLNVPSIRHFAATQVNRFTGNDNLVLYGSLLLLGVLGAVIFFAVNKFLL